MFFPKGSVEDDKEPSYLPTTFYFLSEQLWHFPGYLNVFSESGRGDGYGHSPTSNSGVLNILSTQSYLKLTINEAYKPFASLKVNFSVGLESIKPFRFYQTNTLHAFVPEKRDSEHQVNAQLFFAEFSNYLLHLRSPELKLNTPQVIPKLRER